MPSESSRVFVQFMKLTSVNSHSGMFFVIKKKLKKTTNNIEIVSYQPIKWISWRRHVCFGSPSIFPLHNLKKWWNNQSTSNGPGRVIEKTIVDILLPWNSEEFRRLQWLFSVSVVSSESNYFYFVFAKWSWIWVSNVVIYVTKLVSDVWKQQNELRGRLLLVADT